MAKILQKLSGKKGQHSIEFAVVMIVVMAGIIIMGRYVIRSWNANMQSWEDTAIDSLMDPMLPAPTIDLGPCRCTMQPVGCGPLGGCPSDQFFHRCECSPLGCGLGNPLAGCGSVPESSGVCVCDVNCCTLPTVISCGPPNCPPRKAWASYVCGCGAAQFTCIDDPICLYECVPPIDIPLNSQQCPGYGFNLPADTNNVLRTACSGATSGHCELTCIPPYFPIAGNTACGLCPPGTVLQGNCPSGSCETPAFCATGQCQAA